MEELKYDYTLFADDDEGGDTNFLPSINNC